MEESRWWREESNRLHHEVPQLYPTSEGLPGADGGSDHVPIVATLIIKLRMLKQKKSGDRLETQLLRTRAKYREQYQQRIVNQLNDIYAID